MNNAELDKILNFAETYSHTSPLVIHPYQAELVRQLLDTPEWQFTGGSMLNRGKSIPYLSHQPYPCVNCGEMIDHNKSRTLNYCCGNCRMEHNRKQKQDYMKFVRGISK